MGGQTQPLGTNAKDTQNQKRQRSSIAFPYMDLESAIEMAKAIYNNVGHGDCDDDQLAAWTNQSNKSSTFRVQIYTARTFGLLQGEGSRHSLTQLGRAIIDPHQEREAKISAFLSVELYNAVYEKYKGGTIPPAAAFERDIVSMGVAEKQKDRARQAFERSAQQAGFFEHGNNRLVKPGINPSAKNPEKSPENKLHSNQKIEHGGGGSGDGGGEQDPLIAAIIKKLPKSGAWDADQRVTWFQMMAMAFQLSYGQTEQIEIKKAAQEDGAKNG